MQETSKLVQAKRSVNKNDVIYFTLTILDRIL